MSAGKKLAYFVTVVDDNGDQHTYGPEDTVPGWAAKAITNPSAWADDAAVEADDSDEGDKPYDEWSKAELEDEITRRNEGRADDGLIVVEGKGNKPDLVAALEADDSDA